MSEHFVQLNAEGVAWEPVNDPIPPQHKKSMFSFGVHCAKLLQSKYEQHVSVSLEDRKLKVDIQGNSSEEKLRTIVLDFHEPEFFFEKKLNLLAHLAGSPAFKPFVS